MLVEGVEERLSFRRVGTPSAVAQAVGGPPAASPLDSESGGGDGSGGGGGGVFSWSGPVAIGDPSDEVAGTGKLYVLDRGLALGSLRRDLFECSVPDGYAFAVDVELHFGPRLLTAASTASAGSGSARAERPRFAESDIPNVWVVRLEQPDRFVALECPTAASALVDVFKSEQGTCVTWSGDAGGEGDVSGDTISYRLSDGAALAPRQDAACLVQLPTEETAGAVFAKRVP